MNSADTLTPWFDPEVKPVRVGEYNASRLKAGTLLRWWNGSQWSMPYTNRSERKKECRNHVSVVQDGIFWRGLARDPAKLPPIPDKRGIARVAREMKGRK